MPVITIQSDGILEQVRDKLAQGPSWVPPILQTHMLVLGQVVEDVMRDKLEEHNYTGELQNSIMSEYDNNGYTISIFPMAQRGGWDGGTLLEMGTRPHKPPWAPIAAWAEFRGLDPFPIWWGIAHYGTKKHPFLRPTLNDPRTQSSMQDTAEKIIGAMAVEITMYAFAKKLEIATPAATP